MNYKRNNWSFLKAEVADTQLLCKLFFFSYFLSKFAFGIFYLFVFCDKFSLYSPGRPRTL